MRAFVYEQAGVSRLVNDLPQPQAQRDTAVIKVRACTLCGTDLRAWQHGNKMVAPPRVMGHELCGEIVEAGSDRKDFRVGQRISMAPAIGCGSCYPCRRGFGNLCDNLQTIGFNFDGGFAEYMEVPAIAFERGNVYATPEGVPDEEAALAEPIACVVNGQEFLRIEPGDSVAIFGSGFIGCMHAELARMKGADPVILIEPNRSRAEAAHALVPFVKLVVSSTVDLHAEVKRLTEGRGVDVIVTACPAGAGAEGRARAGRQAGEDQPLRRPGEGDHRLPRQQPHPLQGAVGPRRPRLHAQAEPAGDGLDCRRTAERPQVHHAGLPARLDRGRVQGPAGAVGLQGGREAGLRSRALPGEPKVRTPERFPAAIEGIQASPGRDAGEER